MNKAQKILESKIRKMVKRKLAEMLMAGPGFSKSDVYKLNLLRHEASINKKDDFEPPVKAGKSGVPSTEPPVDKEIGSDTGLDVPKNGKGSESPDMGSESPFGNGKSDKPKEEKPKSKDWEEVTNELYLYVKQASGMIGDENGEQKDKILKKLVDAVSSKFSDVPEEMSAGIDTDSGLDEKKKSDKDKKKDKKKK